MGGRYPINCIFYNILHIFIDEGEFCPHSSKISSNDELN